MGKILLVDDDPKFRAYADGILRRHGHVPVEIDLPEEALTLPCGERPDVLLLGLGPAEARLEVLRKLRAEPWGRLLPVLTFSRRQGSEQRIKSLRAGADDHLAKSAAPEEILVRIDRLLERGAQWRSADGCGADWNCGWYREDAAGDLFGALVEIELRLREGESPRGVRIGRYEICGVLGEGAMGLVLTAWDDRLRRLVALKTFRFDDAPDDARRQATDLLAEAERCASFRHPNIITIFDLEQQGPVVFVAMELVEGVTLREYLDRGATPETRRMAVEEVILIGRAIADALAAAHEKGLLHRDIKPGNVLLGLDGSIKIADFGLAAPIEQARTARSAWGTPGYAAPEVVLLEGASHATDLFALGVVLYECLVGRHPFRGETLDETIEKVLWLQPAPVRRLRPETPQWLSLLVDELLAKAPRDRPADAWRVERSLTEKIEDHHLRWRFHPGAAASASAALRSKSSPRLGSSSACRVTTRKARPSLVREAL